MSWRVESDTSFLNIDVFLKYEALKTEMLLSTQAYVFFAILPLWDIHFFQVSYFTSLSQLQLDISLKYVFK